LCLKLDSDIPADKDQCAGFVEETLNDDTTRCLPSIPADVQIFNPCTTEYDLDDIAEFPIFTQQKSRRLRRTSIKIFRKSFHDAEDIATEDQCDIASFSGNTENETAEADTEMNSVNDGVLCDELALLTTIESLTSPTIAVEKEDLQSNVLSVTLPSDANSNTILKAKTGNLCSYDNNV